MLLPLIYTWTLIFHFYMGCELPCDLQINIWQRRIQSTHPPKSRVGPTYPEGQLAPLSPISLFACQVICALIPLIWTTYFLLLFCFPLIWCKPLPVWYFFPLFCFRPHFLSLLVCVIVHIIRRYFHLSLSPSSLSLIIIIVGIIITDHHSSL